jgi:hypothetical protein
MHGFVGLIAGAGGVRLWADGARIQAA